MVSHRESVTVAPEAPRSLELRSTAKTARLLDCSVRTVYRLVERGELAPVHVGRVLRFEVDEIRRYLHENREQRREGEAA